MVQIVEKFIKKVRQAFKFSRLLTSFPSVKVTLLRCFFLPLLQCKPEYKVAGLYVVDSIVRQSRHQFGADKDVFGPRFTKNITITFANLCLCPVEDRVRPVKSVQNIDWPYELPDTSLMFFLASSFLLCRVN